MLERLKEWPEGSVDTLDSLSLLIALCQEAAPATAAEIKAELIEELRKEQHKASKTVSNEIPNSAVPAEIAEAMENNDINEKRGPRAADTPIAVATKISNRPRWEQWVRNLITHYVVLCSNGPCIFQK